jgi:lipoprotein-releasing system permease protein
MALVIAIAVTTGFRNTLERNLLGAMAHINVSEKPNNGIEDWRDLWRACKPPRTSPRFRPRSTPGVSLRRHPVARRGAERRRRRFRTGHQRCCAISKPAQLDRLRDPNASPPGIILGARLAEDTGMRVNDNITLVSPEGELTPFGPRPAIRRFKVCGIYETGFFDIDDTWAFTSIAAAQKALSLEDVINQIELKVDDLNRAPEIARDVEARGGQPLHHHHLAGAQQATARRAAHGAHRGHDRDRPDSAGGRAQYFHYPGNDGDGKVPRHRHPHVDGRANRPGAAHLHVAGSADRRGGQRHRPRWRLHAGYFADKYRWMRLDEAVYSLSFVPFEAHWVDGVWIAAAAILVSFLATLYPQCHRPQRHPHASRADARRGRPKCCGTTRPIPCKPNTRRWRRAALRATGVAIWPRRRDGNR